MSQSPRVSMLSQFMRGTSRKIQRLFGAELIYPYMKEREVDIITEILLNNKPKRCLEYGSGYSTLYFPRFLDRDAKWISIEHEHGWHKLIEQKLKEDPMVDYHCVPPNADEWEGDGTYEQFKDYVDYPKSLGGKFDFILVDGRARTDCAIQMLEQLSEDGILLMHDANRSKYHFALSGYAFNKIIEDHRKNAGGFAFAAHKPIADFLDVEKHARIWKKGARVSNVFKFKYLLGKKSKSFRLHEYKG